MSSALYTNGQCTALRLSRQAQNRWRTKKMNGLAHRTFAKSPMNTGISWTITSRTKAHVCYRNPHAEIAFPGNPSCFSDNSHFSPRALIFSTIPPHIHTVLTSNGQTSHNNSPWPHSGRNRIFCFVVCTLLLFAFHKTILQLWISLIQFFVAILIITKHGSY